MKERCIPLPDENTWNEIAKGFQIHANFPNCLGAVDGKHIRVVKPEQSGSLYMNYKHFFLIALLAIADTNYKFVYVDVGSFGKDSDSTIFRNSSLWKHMERNTLSIPTPTRLPESDIAIPYAFVGDEAFGLHRNLLRPYSGTHLPVYKRVFNYRLSRARRYIENAHLVFCQINGEYYIGQSMCALILLLILSNAVAFSTISFASVMVLILMIL